MKELAKKNKDAIRVPFGKIRTRLKVELTGIEPATFGLQSKIGGRAKLIRFYRSRSGFFESDAGSFTLAKKTFFSLQSVK